MTGGPLTEFREQVAADLHLLAGLHDRELDQERILGLWEHCYSGLLGLRLVTQAGVEALALLRDGLTDIPVALDPGTLDHLAADYASIYLHHGLGASPCESVWLDPDQLAMQEPMFQLRRAYAARGLAVPDWRHRPDDHLVYQLAFLAVLLGEGGGETGPVEAAGFLDDHCLRWIGDFAKRVAPRCATRFYAGLALVTAAYLEELRDLLAQILDQPRPVPQDPLPAPHLEQPPSAFPPGAGPSW